MRITCVATRWAVKWHSRNQADGLTEYFMWEGGYPLLFRSRREARTYIREKYDYITTRADLRAEPHGWRLPRAVRVRVELRESVVERTEGR